MKGRESVDPESKFPSPSIQHVPMPKFHAGSISKETMQEQFGFLSLMKARGASLVRSCSATDHVPSSNEKWKPPMKSGTATGTATKGNDRNKVRKADLQVMRIPLLLSEFTLERSHFSHLCILTYQNDKIWVSGNERKILLVDRKGNVLQTIDTLCWMCDISGLYCSDDGGLIFCDVDGKAVKKLSQDFCVTTLFTTGNSKPRGVCQLPSGSFVVGMPHEEVLRVYDGAGRVLREIGKGHLQSLYSFVVNKFNGDIYVSRARDVIAFSTNGDKRFTYGKDRTLGPRHLCCDQLGNILITDKDNHRVHIIDKDGHFLQYLVSGKENIQLPFAIDIDDMGYAWVGEWATRKVKAFQYLS